MWQQKKNDSWHSALFRDQCLAQQAPRKLPSISDGNKCKDPSPVIIQRIRELGILSLKWDISKQSLPLGLRKPWGRGGWKPVRVRNS